MADDTLSGRQAPPSATLFSCLTALLPQDLTLTITSERSEAELELEEDSSEISSINVQSFVDEQEWKLHSHVETWKRVTTRIYHNSKYKHPAFSTSCRASRRPGFFIWNIFLVMVGIAWCNLMHPLVTTLPHRVKMPHVHTPKDKQTKQKQANKQKLALVESKLDRAVLIHNLI